MKFHMKVLCVSLNKNTDSTFKFVHYNRGIKEMTHSPKTAKLQQRMKDKCDKAVFRVVKNK